MRLAFVIPVLNEEHTLRPLAQGISRHAAAFNHRIIFVDDGSTDASAETIRAIQAELPQVDFLRLRRHFGKSQALAAGICAADADIIITMDADLQDDPKEIPRLLAAIEQGCDLVCGWKQRRQDPLRKRLPSRVFNAWVTRLFRLPLHDVNTGFKAMRCDVARAVPLHGEMHRFVPVFAAHYGFRVGEIPVEHHPRRYGHSKYNWRRFAKGALDLIAVWFIVRHGETPGHFFRRIALWAAVTGSLLLAAALVGVIGGMYPVSALTILFSLFGVLAWLAAAVAMGLGMVAELLVYRLAAPPPESHIAERHMGTVASPLHTDVFESSPS